MDTSTWQATVYGVTESDMTGQLSTHIHTNLFYLDFSKTLMPLSLFPHRYISGRYIKAMVVQPFLFLPRTRWQLSKRSPYQRSFSIAGPEWSVYNADQLKEWHSGLGTSCLGALGGCLVLCSMFSIPGLEPLNASGIWLPSHHLWQPRISSDTA